MARPESRTAEVPATHRFLPLLLLLFVGSGCAALIYEIVWFQLLQLIIGSSAVSLGVVLGTFMGGMCIGSLGLARVISRRQHPMRVYALLELGIGVFGLLELFGLPYAGGLYTSIAGHGIFGLLLRGLFCAVALLPPTLMMGATLPAIARWIETTPRGVSWMGFFYGGNTAGAVFGCLLAGFYLLRVFDIATATYVAIAINVVVAALAIGLANITPYSAGADDRKKHALMPPGTWPVYATIALSGMSALGAEVVWTRLLSLLLGGTTYTFSIILAVFLVGIGLGSTAGSYLARTLVRPRMALGVAQLLLVVALAWTAFMLAKALPYWPINPGLAPAPRYLFELDFARCVWAVLPAACLWGASFPLALAAVATGEEDGGRLVGGVYAANTVGAIVGAVAFSLIAIPTMGTQGSQRALILLAALGGLIMLLPQVVPSMSALAGGEAGSDPSPRGVGALVASVLVAILLFVTVPQIPFELIAYGRQLPWRLNQVKELYRGEGMSTSIGVSELPNGVRNYHSAGKVQASSEPQDMRLQRMLAAIPVLFSPNPKTVLNVGFGAGVTAGGFMPSPQVKRLVICELEPLVPVHVGPLFAEQNYAVYKDPRTEIVIDDARHYILTTKEKFDVITSDPLDPWVKGTAALYTTEYLQVVKEHLNPGGMVSQFVQLYESNVEAVKSEIGTFFQVFPNGTIWGNTNNGEGYDLVLLGQVEPLTLNIDSLQAKLERPDESFFNVSLNMIGFRSVYDLLATYGGRPSDLAPWLKDAEINRDRNLRMQYLAGTGLNFYQAGPIYTQILAYRKFPDNLFTGSPASLIRLKQAILSGGQ